MIAFGCSVTSPEVFERYAGPGIRLAAEPDSELLVDAAAGSVARSYNLILRQAAADARLEATVLVHQDAEIIDRDLCAKLRVAFGDPAVAVVGCVGAVGAHTMAWWEGSVTWEQFLRSYPDLEDVEIPRLSWNGEALPPDAALGEVDTLDGFLMALSPWAVRNLRFDESLDITHGYDFDLCLQARAAGRKVVVADIRALHHHSLKLVTDLEAWCEAHMRVAEKWDGRMPHLPAPDDDLRRRARRAEAEAGVARLASASKLLQAAARAEREENELDALMDTASWRITEPLRRVNALRRRVFAAGGERSQRPETQPTRERIVRAERVPAVDDSDREP